MVGQSVIGTSHRESGEECQDRNFYSRLHTESGEFLVAACADGAGSASHSGAGAECAVQSVISVICRHLESESDVSALDDQQLRDWYTEARRAVEKLALERELPLREFASTLLVAIVSPKHAWFAQLGDGCAVYSCEEKLAVALWPQNGEFANLTNFLTGDDFLKQIEICHVQGEVQQLAMTTDGLQSLALDLKLKEPFRKFFLPLFDTLLRTESTDELLGPLQALLSSEAVCARTDDDKTLILAARTKREQVV